MRNFTLTVLVYLISAAPSLADDLLFFRSPTGNINCLIATGDYAVARCDMKQLTPSFTAPPPDCDLDWGASFAIGLSDRKGQLACVGVCVGSLARRIAHARQAAFAVRPGVIRRRLGHAGRRARCRPS